eukprot:581108_1
MKFKIIYNNDIRIFKSETDNLNQILPAIRTFVSLQFGIDNYNATYLDEEDEKITISNDEDLEDALRRYKEMKKIPKIYVTPRTLIGILPTPQSAHAMQQELMQKLHQYSDPDLSSLSAQQWMVQPSLGAMQTRNKIFEVMNSLDTTILPPDKEFISIAIGDPTTYPNLLPSPSLVKAVHSKLLSQQSNGYAISYGLQEARVAIAKKFSVPHIKYTEDDVILGIGASDALNMSLCALLNPGENFLGPRPGYSFYDTVASRYNFEIQKYKLDPENEWQVDIQHMRSLINKKTRAILVCNPSNPCGSVLTEENLLSILQVAEDFSIPIITDEVYGEMVYDHNHGKNRFHSLASLSKTVPILSVNGLSKQYLVPGWRVGWVIIHDPVGAFLKVRTALRKLSTVLLGPNTLIQSSIPSILFETPESWYSELSEKLYRQSTLLFSYLEEIDALTPVKGRGAWYLMVKIELNKLKGIKNDIDFANKLVREQAILVLPGTIFGMANYFRVVICPPSHVIAEIGKRMKEFCLKHSVNTVSTIQIIMIIRWHTQLYVHT